MQPVSVRDLVVQHAERVSAGHHFWSIPFPEREPVRFVHIYGHERGHWHFVTEGLHQSLGAIARGRHSEIELTLRLPRSTESPSPAPIDLLRRLGFILLDQPIPEIDDTAVFEPPLAPEPALAAFAYVADVELVPPEGLELIQCVGLTRGEARACVRGSTLAIVDRLRADSPHLVTDPHRAELADLPASGALPVSRGHTVPTLRWQLAPLGAHVALEIEPTRMRPTFIEHLLARLRGDAFFQVRGPERTVRWEPGPACRLELAVEDGRELLRVFVDGAALERFAARARPEGDEPLEVGPSEIRFVDEP